MKHEVQGTVQGKITLEKDGRLRSFNEASWTGPPQLKGWVMGLVMESLRDPFLDQPMPRALELDMRAHFAISTMQYGFIDGRHITLGQMDFYVNHAIQTGPGINVGHVVTLLENFFGPSLKSDKSWDFEERLTFYKEACDVRKAEGGCHQTGEILKTLGRIAEANVYFAREQQLISRALPSSP